jgi:hypothetical protein
VHLVDVSKNIHDLKQNLSYNSFNWDLKMLHDIIKYNAFLNILNDGTAFLNVVESQKHTIGNINGWKNKFTIYN